MKKIVRVNSDFKNVTVDNSIYQVSANVFFTIERPRKKLDVNGNKMINVYIFDEYDMPLVKNYKGRGGRVYTDKGYISLQQKELSSTLYHLFNV